jgi:hypothetical protein
LCKGLPISITSVSKYSLRHTNQTPKRKNITLLEEFFDINEGDLKAVEEALEYTWSELDLVGQPVQSLACIAKDEKRIRRNA